MFGSWKRKCCSYLETYKDTLVGKVGKVQKQVAMLAHDALEGKASYKQFVSQSWRHAA